MPTVDQMILELCERGFTLPEGLDYSTLVSSNPRWVLVRPMTVSIVWDQFPMDKAHDLCAMHFARESAARGNGVPFEFGMNLSLGDSAAAIQALWEATQ